MRSGRFNRIEKDSMQVFGVIMKPVVIKFILDPYEHEHTTGYPDGQSDDVYK
jgi:hypothetical protein